MKRYRHLLRLLSIILAIVVLVGFTSFCGKGDKSKGTNAADQKMEPEVDMALQKQAETFLEKYLADFEKAYVARATTGWVAANSGKNEDFNAAAKAELEYNQLHSDPQRFAEIEKFIAQKDKLKPLTARSLQVAWLGFKGNQLPTDLLEKMANMSAEIQQIFTNFRGKIDGKTYNDNALIDLMKNETKSAKRQKIWEAQKQVGEAVAAKLIALAKVRNESAVKLGFKNYWDMQIRLQEHDPEQLMAIFDDVEKKTNEPFKAMKAKMDAEIAAKLKVKPEELMPWHYEDPFFQKVPPSDKVDLDEFYQNKKKEEIVEIARKFYSDIDLPIDDIIAASDIYEREGKQQHAFCTSLTLKGDAHAQLNIKPTAEWMDTTLHEMGHGIYYKYADLSLPINLRDAAHPFTTEAIAMLFGALSKNPTWMIAYASADPNRVKEVEGAILEQRRREQLIFARWTLVMLNFEKALYENPDQDLNTLWWDMVERYQMLKRPPKRNAADWASKIHFAIAPVYYHNYMLGELFSAQLRSSLVKLANHQGPTYTLNYGQHKEFGKFLKEKVFAPGMTFPWPEFVKYATGEPLNATYFAEELK